MIKKLLAGELVWSLTGSISLQAVNFATFLLLARVLGPEPYGILGLAAVALAFAWSILNEGTSEFLIRAPTVTRAHINATFWLQLVLAILLAAGMAAVMERLALATGEPELSAVLPLLCGIPLLYALASAQRALLQRALRFKLLAVCSLTAAVISGGVGIVAALQGAGALSLALMMLVQWIVLAALLWWVSDWRPSFAFGTTELRDVARFGTHMVVANLASLAELQGVRLIVGLIAGPVGLGLFTMAWRIVEVIGALLLIPVTQVAVPALAAVQHDRAAFVRKLSGFLRLTALISLPAYAGIMAIAPDMIRQVFGPHWMEAVLPLQVLCLLGIGWAVSLPLDAAIVSTGQVAWRTRLSMCGLAVVLGGCAATIALGQGLLAMTIVIVLRQVVVIPLYVSTLVRQGYLDLRGLARDLSLIALSTGLMLSAALTMRQVAVLPEPALLTASIGAGAAVYIVSVFVLTKEIACSATRMLLPMKAAPSQP